MGYYASGSGTITVRKNTPADVIDCIRETMEIDISDWFQDETIDISVWDDGKYYDDEIIEMLDRLERYTVSGEIRYLGDDDLIWCFYFDEARKKWDSENGEIVFPHDIKKDDSPIMASSGNISSVWVVKKVIYQGMFIDSEFGQAEDAEVILSIFDNEDSARKYQEDMINENAHDVISCGSTPADYILEEYEVEY